MTRIIQIIGFPMIATVRSRNTLESKNIFMQQLEGNCTVNIYIYIYIYIYVCVCVCVCIYIYIYISCEK